MMPLVCQLLPVPAITLPLVGSIFGALALLYEAGSKLSSTPLSSFGWPKKLQRTPRKRVRFGRILKSSCAKASCCHAQRFGVMSWEGMVNVLTLPSRKLAQPCWKLLVPLGAPVFRKLNVPCWLAAFSVLL